MLLFVKALVGEIKLPSKKDMDEDTLEDMRLRSSMGLAERHAHHMFGKLLWQYDDHVSMIGHIKPIKKVVRDICDYLAELRPTDVVGYKEYNFIIESDTQFRVNNTS